jgi:uncharacterized membrane protein YhaH (DUF805 family)
MWNLRDRGDIVLGTLRLLFSFFGRINRAKYWLGFALVYAFWGAVMGTWYAALPHDDVSNGVVGAAMLAGCVSFFSLIAKRLHDAGQTAWWIVVGIAVLGFSATPKDDTFRSITSLLLVIAVIVLGSAKGQEGRNKFGPDPLEGKRKKKGMTASEQSAYEKGQEFSNSTFEGFDTFMRERFEPVRARYLEIFKGNVREALHATDAPPLTVARVEYRVFLNNVKELEEKMLTEIKQYMHEWLDVAHQIGVGEDTERAFGVRVNDFTAGLSMDALKALTDYAVPLKDADIDWRRANLERAKEFPEPE